MLQSTPLRRLVFLTQIKCQGPHGITEAERHFQSHSAAFPSNPCLSPLTSNLEKGRLHDVTAGWRPELFPAVTLPHWLPTAHPGVLTINFHVEYRFIKGYTRQTCQSEAYICIIKTQRNLNPRKIFKGDFYLYTKSADFVQNCRGHGDNKKQTSF
jgi:hypothetical protein